MSSAAYGSTFLDRIRCGTQRHCRWFGASELGWAGFGGGNEERWSPRLHGIRLTQGPLLSLTLLEQLLFLEQHPMKERSILEELRIIASALHSAIGEGGACLSSHLN